MKKALFILTLVFAVAFTVPALAESGHGMKCDSSKQCSMHGKDCGGKSCESGSGCPISAKVIKKATFFLENADAIGLSAAQKATIEGIKLKEEKAGIMAGAYMQSMMLELQAKLNEETVDVAGFEKMIDDGSAGWSAGAKSSVQSYATVKSTLTPEQMAKAKEIWKSKK